MLIYASLILINSMPGVSTLRSAHIFQLVLLMDFLFAVLLFHFAISTSWVEAKNSSVSAILTFGDSTVDPGNNDYIITVLRSNFPPYGRDLPSRTPTGRFCNGRLTSDFIASYLGIKDYVPPYLNKSLSVEELMTGVSFASAGTGYDPFTAQISNVIPVQKQLEYFKEYKARLGVVMGTDKMEEHIRKAGFLVSCGSNDLGLNYFLVPVRPIKYNVTEYLNFMIENVRTFLQGLVDMGARKIGIVGLPPLGCLPFIITVKSDITNLGNRECLEYYSDVANEFNRKLQVELQAMQNDLRSSGVLMVYVDIYKPLLRIITDYKKLGFQEWKRGCCGSGLVEFGYACNPLSSVCSNPAEFVFWDALHPTEKVYRMLFESFREVMGDFIDT